MGKYAYKVRDSQANLLTGQMDGNSVDEVISRLEEKSLVPVSVEELNFDGTLKNRSFFDKINEAILKSQTKVNYATMVFFTRQLATMINGGVALPKALEQLGRNEKATFKRILEKISEDIAMGSTFSDAIGKHPGAFNNMYVSVVRSGEVSGALDQVLDELANYMENAEAMKAKVKAAMRYPAAIGGFVAVIVIGILIKLVPVFKDMYSGFGATLPKPTLVLIAMSDAIRFNAPFVILGIFIMIIAFFVAMNIEVTRYLWQKYLLKFPIFGIILRKNILAIYSRTMALLMNSGTPILEATQIAGAAVSNKHYAKALEAVYNDLKQGELLSASLAKTKEFPILVTQLVSTGEESGKIDELLRKSAEFYEREIKNTVDSIASIIEPILIVTLGAIVGGILIALYLPIFSIGKIIK
ncbi:MAG: type II secretion system F family protein [Chitinispirillales bacterium]|jgi:type IV pilus assembly protein PilC|nr:type II secretion system F family protein [Chitinispirillales bacterium]